MHSRSMAAPEFEDVSSPDPLVSPMIADSPIHSSPKRMHSSTNRTGRNNRNSLASMSILPPSSPSRTVTEQTLSPWKIRVTVEAEPEDQGEEYLQTVTKTTKVPLKDESNQKSRTTKSRTRKSSISEGRRRSVTPTSERQRRQSVTDLDIVVLGDDADEDEWGKKQRKVSPRKAKAKKTAAKPLTNDAASVSVASFEVRQDTDVECDEGISVRKVSPELRQLDLNRVSIRSRGNSIKQKPDYAETYDVEGVQRLRPPPDMGSAGKRTVSANSAVTYPTPSPTASERGQSVEVGEGGSPMNEHQDGFDTIMESEGFTMIDLDSIPSVRHMLSSPVEGQESVSSHQLRSPTESTGTVRRNVSGSTIETNSPPIIPIKAIPPHLVLPEGESDISSTVPSSPPIFQPRPQLVRQKTPLSYLKVPAQPRNRQVTPQIYSSPKLPSPPKQPTLKDRSTPDSAKVMRAGLALQGAIEPVGLYPVLPPVGAVVSKHSSQIRSGSEELFEGYDSGTQRELRAGLRFGEELAKRRSLSKISETRDDYMIGDDTTEVWRGETVILRTPIHVPQEQIQVEKKIPPRFEAAPSIMLQPKAQRQDSPPHQNIEARREHEWQLERQAVSKQIQEASPSKVIVIDSDDEADQDDPEIKPQEHSIQDLTMDDGDIWLEEAKDSSSSPYQEHQHNAVDPMLQPRKIKQSEQKDETIENPPQRKLVPSPWRKGETIEPENHSTIIADGGETSGLLWRSPDANVGPQFGAGAIKNVRRDFEQLGDLEFVTRRNSGSFDIEKMLATPRRIRESLEKERVRPRFAEREKENTLQIVEYQPHEDDFEEEDYDEASYTSSHSDQSASPAPEQQPQTMPINFNDSTASQSHLTPPQSSKPRVSLPPSAARPPTPRSAMKGTRQSFGAANTIENESETANQESKKVIFAQRSRGVNVDWVESSSSVQLSSEDVVSSPIVAHQKHQEERQIIASSSQLENNEKPVAVAEYDSESSTQEETRNQPRKGWFGWLRKSDQTSTSTDARSASTTQVDGTSEQSQHPANHDIDRDQTQWAPTSRNTAALPTSAPRTKSIKSIPPYLQPPSYPSDPSRKPTSPLASNGLFTNTHFRTLHILHRKSQRPRFHAPLLSDCRPDLRALAAQNWKLEVDESQAGLGGFAWTFGDLEARVLERFCREVEYSQFVGVGGSDEDLKGTVTEWVGEGGMWSGTVGHGQGGIQWEWGAVRLATWLGRLVVGEVVREEEFGGLRHG